MAAPLRIQKAATELLGIRHPVLLAGMFAVSSPKLAAAVTNTGGLGVIGSGAYKRDQLRKTLDELKGYLVDKSAPFGVDLLTPQVGGNARKTNYDYSEGKLDDLIEGIIESRAKLFVCAVGIPPPRVVDRLHAGGVLYMNMIGHPYHAQKAIDAGADLLRFTGKEVALIAGGGGLFNGQCLAESLMLGASAVWIGTRFILCDEAGASVSHQQALLEANHGDIIRTTVFTGRPLHAKATLYLRRWEEQRREEKLQLQSQGIIPVNHDLETKPGDEEVSENAHPVLMGKVAPMVTEKLPAKRIVEEMVEAAAQLLRQGTCRL
ncbi:hypothetical protein BDW75DRAFT_235486 [Aspergillus navahoensis]